MSSSVPTPISLALCITELGVGGAERCLTELALGLPSRFCCTVYSLAARPPAPRNVLVQRLEGAGIPIVFLNARRVWDFATVERQLRQHLSAQRPLLLQTFLFHANIVGRVAGWRAGVPHIVAGVRVAERRRAWHLWLDRATSRLVDRYVCVSQAVANFTAQAGIARSKLLVIPNGIDVDRIVNVPDAVAQLPGRRFIACVGRLDEQKRIDWLLQRAARFLPRLPDHDLLIAGDGPAEGRLRRLARELGIHQRVHFLGFQPNIAPILQSCDLLALASAWEGMPNVVLEAMASGKPVVCTAAEGVDELLGLLAASQMVGMNDAAGFENRIVEIAGDPERQKRLGAENRARVSDHFSLREMVARYANLYETLVSDSPGWR